MTYSNEKQLFNAFENGEEIIGSTYTGEVEFGCVNDWEGNAIFVNSEGIITGFQVYGMKVVGTC